MPVDWRAQGNLTTQDLVKPRETKDESMQRADTQIPLRCSPPASSKAQPDHLIFNSARTQCVVLCSHALILHIPNTSILYKITPQI